MIQSSDSLLFFPYSSLLTPHSSLLTPHSSLPLHRRRFPSALRERTPIPHTARARFHPQDCSLESYARLDKYGRRGAVICSAAIALLAARRAIVRPSFNTRRMARAENCSRWVA
jgi:hypothetical protein